MATYKLLDSYTVGAGGAASVTFSNINQTYTDLKVVASARTNRGTYGTDAIWVKLNNSSTNYSGIQLYGFGTTITSNSTTNPLENYAGADDSVNTANTFSNIEWYIPNYTSSNYKSVSSDGSAEDNSSANNMNTMAASLWSNTAAITSATLVPGYGTSFVQYSTFELYGVSNQPATAAPSGTTTIGTAYSSGNTQATVPFTYSGTDASYYVATSSPDGLTATGTTSPLTVTGLTTGTAYTFTVKPWNFAYGPGSASSASNSVTPVGDYVAIATATVDASGASSITFSNIPQNFKHLQIRALVQATNAGSADGQFTALFNGDSTYSNYYAHNIYSTGAALGTQALAGSTYNGAIVGWASATAATGLMANVIDILDYSNSGKNKTTRTLAGFDNNGNGEVDFTSSLWISTSPINSFTLTPSSGNFKQYSTFKLYGVN